MPLSFRGVGQKGDKGDAGAIGLTGVTGAKGDKGDTGAIGLTGATGAKGDKGDTGAIGATGLTGAKGDKGDTGAVGATGLTGLTGAKGDKGDFSSVHPGFISGRYYPPHFYIGVTSANLTAGNVYYSYFFVPKLQTFSAVAFQVNTAVAAAQNARVAIYSIENGLPSTLISDLGAVSIAAASVKEISFNLNLSPAWYAFAFVFDGSGANFVVPSSTLLVSSLIGLLTATKNTNAGIKASFNYAAFPASAPLAAVGYSDIPFIWVKAS